MYSPKSLAFSYLGLLLICFAYSCRPTPPPSQLKLSPIFTDHMVLQQNTKAAIWGTASPNTKIDVIGSWGEMEKTIADKDGNWQTALATPSPASIPYDVSIQTADTFIVVKDILFGEVWLCSGQSNMEMPLKGWPPSDPIANSATEIANANYRAIRMFTVKKAYGISPTKDYSGRWKICTPENAGSFSATAYFFGRALHQKLNVPIGLIHSSWGGTPAESWTEGKHLASMADYKDVLTQLNAAKPQQEALNNWLKAKTVLKEKQNQNWTDLDFGDAALLTKPAPPAMLTGIQLPKLWEQAEVGLDAFDGTILFRKTLQLPASMLHQDLTVELGSIDDADETYFNGQKIGSLSVYNAPRTYAIPKALVTEETNVLSVRVLDTGGGGGFGGQPADMKIYANGKKEQAINIGGSDWHYLPLAEYHNGQLYKYGGTVEAFQERPKVDIAFNAHTPTVLYNSMIAPLVPYTIKGAIWYQGESNAGRAKQYETLFPKMIESWRTVWQQGDFPFYFAQIAPFNYDGKPEAVKSAQLRDAQRKTLAVPNTGMAVTLDIGNPTNIHPANKQDVGNRLALWALAKDYAQKDIVFSGPIYQNHQIEHGTIRVTFQYAESGLMAANNKLTGFEMAGADGRFFPATAKITGQEVVVSSSAVNAPTMVRYAFKNSSAASLFNKAGLPASSFSTEE